MTINDVGVWIGILAGAFGITAAVFTLLWKIFRKVNQMDDTTASAAATAQGLALVDRKLVDVQHELTTNGGGSLKDDVRAIRVSLPDIIDANNEARDASFLEMAGPYVSRFEKHDARLDKLEAGHVEINQKLDRLIDNMKETTP